MDRQQTLGCGRQGDPWVSEIETMPVVDRLLTEGRRNSKSGADERDRPNKIGRPQFDNDLILNAGSICGWSRLICEPARKRPPASHPSSQGALKLAAAGRVSCRGDFASS
jgi:hypothetical protein